jgi:hypothetical protein
MISEIVWGSDGGLTISRSLGIFNQILVDVELVGRLYLLIPRAARPARIERKGPEPMPELLIIAGIGVLISMLMICIGVCRGEHSSRIAQTRRLTR